MSIVCVPLLLGPATGASHGAEWAGVAGTVNNELSRKIMEYKEETEEAVRNVTGKKIEQLTQQIACVPLLVPS